MIVIIGKREDMFQYNSRHRLKTNDWKMFTMQIIKKGSMPFMNLLEPDKIGTNFKYYHYKSGTFPKDS